MNAFEIAQIRQQALYELMDKGVVPKTFNWREFSLCKDFEMKAEPRHGTRFYPVNKETGEVCDCVFEWDSEGNTLLCTKCLLDGT